jgi:hypothetical protein
MDTKVRSACDPATSRTDHALIAVHDFGSVSAQCARGAVRLLMARGLTVYDCACLFHAHPRAIRALLAVSPAFPH